MIVIEDEQRGTWESLGFLVSGLLGSLQVLVSRRDRELPEQSGTPTSTCFFFLFLAPPPASLASTSRTWAWLGLTTTEKGQGHWGEEHEVEEIFIATQVTHLLSCWFFWIVCRTNQGLPQSWRLSERGVVYYLDILAHDGELILLFVHLELLHF